MSMIRMMSWAFLALLAFASLAMAQTTTPGTVTFAGKGLGVGLGVALAIIGAGYGFGKIGSSALESMARQPEVAGQVQTAMIIIGALLEGATFFGLLILFLMNGGPGF